MKIDGVILAGGASSRMGGPKPLLPFGGTTLLDAVIARVLPQVGRLALDVPRDCAERYRERYGERCVVLPDLFADRLGPLCGVVTGLAWLADADWLATFPCDAPFLPVDVVPQLRAAAAEPRPVYAAQDGRMHGVFALWPKACLAPLREGLNSGALRSMRQALETFDAIECPIAAPAHAFFNINTRADLAQAEALVRGDPTRS